MIESGTLQCFDLTLTTQGLLHVGDGKVIPKKFYMLNGNTISYIDEERLFALLLRRNQLERFEAYCLGADTDLGRFFKSIALSPAEQHALVRCTFRSADALDENHSCKEIRPFIRNTANQVYVPGSSIKGALRTALLFSMIQQDGSKKAPLDWQKPRGAFEARYLHQLYPQIERDTPQKDLLRGLSVSDSQVIADSAMCLSCKCDASVSGAVRKLPLCRECIAPGQLIHTTLTLDQSILRGRITKESLLRAIQTFAAYHQKTYAEHFTVPDHAHYQLAASTLFLGGGAGFFSKTLSYPYEGKQLVLQHVSAFMCKSFRAHHHENDPALGISPHTMKYGLYHQELFPFGPCKVDIL